MSLNTAKYLKEHSGQTRRLFNTETGWHEVNKGLRLVVVGYCALVGGGLLGMALIWLAAADHPWTRWLIMEKATKDLVPFGILALLLTAAVSFSLVLWGKWRCLAHAPDRENSKELMLICFICIVICTALSLVGIFTGGENLFLALQRGSEGLETLNILDTGVMLLLCTALLGLVTSLVFNQFLRSIASCFGDKAQMRHVDINLAFISLLAGGSVGGVVALWQFAPPVSQLPWVALGWLLCFVWQLILIVCISRCIHKGLRQLSGLRKAVVVKPAPGQGTMHSLSGLRRLIKPPKL